jgi:hypothetical protein
MLSLPELAVASQNGEAYLASLLGPGYDATWMNTTSLLTGVYKPWWASFKLYTADSSDQVGARVACLRKAARA